MIYFQSDYVEGCHPKILERLNETNFEQTPGYGVDHYCESARAKIKAACGAPDADVHFLVGGTQANLTVIASVLRPYQAVISPDPGHIATHETGAIEATGHKVIALPATDGKIFASQVAECLEEHINSPTKEHTPQPAMVYISYPTESGTIYSKKELTELYETCKKYSLPLFIDGARLGYGLMSRESDLTLSELTSLCDVFYIGGTKCGALFGEAVVITLDSIKKDFRYMIKQRGGMLAKGRLLGLQFDTLFTDNLYFDICKKASDAALGIKDAFLAKGVEMFGTSATNQQFPILNDAQLEHLKKNNVFEVWGKADDGRTVVRFCTSWATKEENVASLLADIAAMPE